MECPEEWATTEVGGWERGADARELRLGRGGGGGAWSGGRGQDSGRGRGRRRPTLALSLPTPAAVQRLRSSLHHPFPYTSVFCSRRHLPNDLPVFRRWSNTRERAQYIMGTTLCSVHKTRSDADARGLRLSRSPPHRSVAVAVAVGAVFPHCHASHPAAPSHIYTSSLLST